MVGVLFFYAGKEKIFDGLGAPPPIEKQFSGTFLDTIPASPPPGRSSASSSSRSFVLTVVSLIRLEFMPARRKPLLLSALALAIFTFSILGIGQNVVGENSGVAELFLYAGATGILFGLVLLMPPYGTATWISGRGGGR